MTDATIACPLAPDAHGEAALMLVESLLHELVARSILPHAAALNAIQIGIDAQVQVSDERHGDALRVSPPAILLAAILDTFEMDAPPSNYKANS